MMQADASFTGSVPDTYDRYLVPVIFEPYASDLAARVAARAPRRILEIAAGTGVATRAMASMLPSDASIVATDLNQAMLDRAARSSVAGVVWRQADALELPFEDGSFDAVVCQFGAMFFPDRAAAFAGARRVLKPGGAFVFSVWDRIEHNEFADTVTTALAGLFPEAPPRFLARTPHGYHSPDAIRNDLRAAGFPATAAIDIVSARSRAASPWFPAIGFCQGTPLRAEIDAFEGFRLDQATTAAATAIGRRFGTAIVDGGMRAHVVTAVR